MTVGTWLENVKVADKCSLSATLIIVFLAVGGSLLTSGDDTLDEERGDRDPVTPWYVSSLILSSERERKRERVRERERL